MAKLSDFLGGIASGISHARVNSDVQSLRIAEEYEKNEFLKHFPVPRMRIDMVELNIPVAVGNLVETTQKIYQPIDKSIFSTKANQQVLTYLPVSRLTTIVSENLKEAIKKSLAPAIEESIKSFDVTLKANPKDDSLQEFSNNIASKTANFIENFYKENDIKIATKELNLLKDKVSMDLQATFKDHLIYKEIKTLDAVDIIVESDKLREIKPENVIMIKMTLSEQGMEWVTMEDKDGKLVNKLMPE